jgi:putative ABC transport system permease protein
MFMLARKILLHDTLRFFIAVGGVGFAVMLALLQLSFYHGFLNNASCIIDHTGADLWVMARGIQNFDFTSPIPLRHQSRIRSIAGVAWVEPLIVSMALWRLETGGLEGVEVIGLNPDRSAGLPWAMVAGLPASIREPGTLIMDAYDLPKFHLHGISQGAELGGARVKVVGLTRGIRSFTTVPYAFTSIRNARTFTRVGNDDTTYLLVGLEPEADVAAIKARIRRIVGVDVYTKAEFAARTREYWQRTTGVATVLITSAILGLLVGMVVVGQTLYASTVEHLKEFGTYKALGASNGDLVRIIIIQSLIAGGVGFLLGLALIAAARQVITTFTDLPSALYPVEFLGMLAVTVAMCIAASYFSIRKATRLEPAMVFKG